MLDPEIIPASTRRIGAFAIDFGLLAVLSGLVARSRLQRFEVTERTPGTNEPIWTATQFDRLTELSQGFNRKFERGDTLFVIDGTGVLITLLVAMVLGVILFVAIPANTGWSPGKRLFSLRVVDQVGATPALPAFAVRTIVGIVDLLPFVVPGLLGFVLAARDPEGHRLGDRVAGTTVVDARKPLRFVDASMLERRSSLRAQDDLDAEDDDSMVDLGDRLNTTVGVRTDRAPSVEEEAEAVSDLAAAASPAAPQATPTVEGATEPSQTASRGRSANSYPPPSHRRPAHDSGPHDSGPHGSTAWTPMAAPAWDPPIAEPAPVWYPTEPETSTTRTSTTETVPATGLTSTAGQPNPAERSGPDPQAAPLDASVVGSDVVAEDPGTPVWNDQWQAWLFWDASIQRWLRHDDATGHWVLIG